MRVLMTCQPAFSHAVQLAPLARELKQRGHTVVLATSADFAPSLIEHGFDARSFTPDWTIRPGDHVYDRTVGQDTFFGFPQVPDHSSVERLRAIALGCEADLVIRDYAEFVEIQAMPNTADTGRFLEVLVNSGRVAH